MTNNATRVLNAINLFIKRRGYHFLHATHSYVKVWLTEASHNYCHVYWLSFPADLVVVKKEWRKWRPIFLEECKNAGFHDDVTLKIH